MANDEKIQVDEVNIKDKFDLKAVEKLGTLSDSDYVKALPSLIQWTEDSNWPVSGPLAQVIFQRMPLSEDEVLKVLSASHSDDTWKWHLLSLYSQHLTKIPGETLLESMRRIVESPTDGEKQEEVDEMAREVLKKIEKMRGKSEE